MATAKVGLVMAAYNAEKYLQEASVRTQTFEDFVCVIMNDGSKDGTAELAKKLTYDDGRFVVWSGVNNQGPAVARNFGAARMLPSSTDYIAFPDADDVWRPDALARLVKKAELGSGVGAHGLADVIDSNGTPLPNERFADFGRTRYTRTRFMTKKHLPVSAPTTYENLIWACTVYPPGAWLLRRDIFDEVGGFDPALRYFEDWDLQLRASRYGDFAFLNEVVVEYRRHRGQTTYNPSAKPLADLAIGQMRRKSVEATNNTYMQLSLARRADRVHRAHATYVNLRAAIGR